MVLRTLCGDAYGGIDRSGAPAADCGWSPAHASMHWLKERPVALQSLMQHDPHHLARGDPARERGALEAARNAAKHHFPETHRNTTYRTL